MAQRKTKRTRRKSSKNKQLSEALKKAFAKAKRESGGKKLSKTQRQAIFKKAVKSVYK